MGYIILFQLKKGKRRHPYGRKTYDTKEAAEQQLNDIVETRIELLKYQLEETKIGYQERIKNIPKQYTIKEA